jgi:Mitochondrial K+-H+ exchange-related
VNVYLIPLGTDRFEPYFEHEDEDEAPAQGSAPGFFARMSARFSEMIREAERQRHERPHHQPPTTLGRLQHRLMGWVAERVAEQRLLWRLRSVDEATLHIPDTMDPDGALQTFRTMLQKDNDRHLRLLIVHALGLVASAPFMVVPGPNLFGYFFTFTVVGHFLAFRGARRGLSGVRWTVVPNAGLTTLGRAMSAPGPERYRLVHEIGERLQLPRLARFVERMAVPPA